MGKNAAYTDATGRYFVFGHLFDMKEQRDLTAERVEKAATGCLRRIAAGDAIKIVRGKGERVLAVFSDPDCPYCRRLESNSTSSTTSRSTPSHYPLEGLHPEAVDKRSPSGARRIARSAWADLMKIGKAPAKPQVRSPDRTEHPARPAAGHPGNADHAFRRRTHCCPARHPRERIEQWLQESRR
jgi:thiol:disulfide interchange protein DsbC